MVRTLAVCRKGHDPEAARAEAAFRREGYEDVRVEVTRLFKIEGECDPRELARLLANPAAGESVAEEKGRPRAEGCAIVEVAYRPAVVDPETHSGLEMAEILGVRGLEWLRLVRRYTVYGVRQEEAERVIRKHLFNDVVQVIVGPDDYRETLRPSGTPDPVRTFDLSALSDEELAALNRRMNWYAPLAQLKTLREHQAQRGRPWTDVEIEMVVQSWGDHCYHTTWKGLGLLKALQEATHRINHPLCLSVFVDNAGAIKFYEGWALAIKGETHNHPSSISTKGGIETKHGGVLRDIIFMGRGGYPIGSSTIMGTRPPSEEESTVPAGALHPRTIVLESIEGTASYCNPMGVPMMYAYYRAHPGYAKCFALGHSVGLLPEKYVKKLKPEKGDVLILIGGATGRDGIHGAVASSAELTAEMVEKEAATVQIGHPITERKFTTMIPLLRDNGWIKTCTDLGAGGISCAVGEICADCGADVCLDGLPLKDTSLAAWEKWLSESQERGLLVVAPEHVDDVLATCRRFGVDAFVLGTCRDDRRLVVTQEGEAVADLDLGFLWSSCPIEELKTRDPGVERKPVAPDPRIVPDADVAARVLGDYACCDQSWAVYQFDSTVQGRTVVGPLTNGVPSDAYVGAPLRGKPYGFVSTCAFNPRAGDADPEGSVGWLMALAITRAVAVGASPDEITLCGNYYTPRADEIKAWYLKRMVTRAIALSELFGTPFISGKDSSSGTFQTADGKAIDVPFTFVPSTLCRIPDVRRITRKPFRHPGEAILALRPACAPNLGGAVVLDALGLRPEHAIRLPWPEDAQAIVALWRALAEVRELLSSAAAVGEGGAFLQIFHACLASGLGAELSLAPDVALWELFGEPPAALVVSTSEPELLRERLAQACGEAVHVVRLGYVSREEGIELRVGDKLSISRDDWPRLVHIWRTAFLKEVGQ